MECLASEVAKSVLGHELEALQMVSPNAERAGSTRFTQVIVASVLDDDAQALVAREVDSELNLGHGRGVDGISRISTNGASRIAPFVGWKTRPPLIHWPHDRCWIVHAGRAISNRRFRHGAAGRRLVSRHSKYLLCVGTCPVADEGLAFPSIVYAPVLVARRCNGDGFKKRTV